MNKNEREMALITALSDLLTELASELDLHYEDEDFFALSPTIERMKAAATLIVAAGGTLPESYNHILARFNRNYH